MEHLRHALALENEWNDDILPIISFTEWYSRLEARVVNASDSELEKIVSCLCYDNQGGKYNNNEQPALRLLEFFRSLAHSIDSNPTAVPLGPLPRFETTKMEQMSSAVANANQLTSEDARRWVTYWISTGFLN